MRVLIDAAGAERMVYTRTAWHYTDDAKVHYFAARDLSRSIVAVRPLPRIRFVGTDALDKLIGKVVEAEEGTLEHNRDLMLNQNRDLPHRLLTVLAVVKPRAGAKRGSVPNYAITLTEWLFLFQTPDGN